jgi:hypothetical protein
MRKGMFCAATILAGLAISAFSSDRPCPDSWGLDI